MPILTKANLDVRKIVDAVIAKYHEGLTDAGVTIGLLMASPTEKEQDEDPPYIKLNGYPCAAFVKITSYRDRVQGIADAVITIDEETWKGLDEDERIALIDHEATHLTLNLDADGLLKRDDAGRPKLKMRLHDVVLGSFHTIIKRHGMKSLDAQELHRTFTIYKQQLFSWGDDQAEQDQPEKASFAGVR